MDWGIHIPSTAMETAPEVNAPTHLGSIRRHFLVAILDAKSPHWGEAMARLQRENPTQVLYRQVRESHAMKSIVFRLVVGVKIELKSARAEANQRNRRN